MIFKIMDSNFETELSLEQLPNFIREVLRRYMEDNDYFNEETFIEFLEENDEIESSMSTTQPIYIVSGVQLEKWVEEICQGYETDLRSDPDPEYEEADDDEYEEEEDDEEED